MVSGPLGKGGGGLKIAYLRLMALLGSKAFMKEVFVSGT